MKSFLSVLVMIFSLGNAISLVAEEAKKTETPDPHAILVAADKVRNPSDSFEMDVVVSNADGRSSEFKVFTRGKEQTLIRTLKPARDKGRDLLMDGQSMWAYIPNLKRAVRVSLSQKLTGEAANGDIARMRWADDYDATIEEQNDESYQLLLKAKKKGLTYEGLRVWIKKENFFPLKAEYLAVSGKILKKSVFRGYREIAGAVRPTEILIEDAHRSSRTSTITIRSMKTGSFPAAWFQSSSLGK